MQAAETETTQLVDFIDYPEGYITRECANHPWEFVPVIDGIDCEEFMGWLLWQDLYDVRVVNYSVVCPSLAYVQKLRSLLPDMVSDYLKARCERFEPTVKRRFD